VILSCSWQGSVETIKCGFTDFGKIGEFTKEGWKIKKGRTLEREKEREKRERERERERRRKKEKEGERRDKNQIEGTHRKSKKKEHKE